VGLTQLSQWIARILQAEGELYSLAEIAAAFEIGAWEALAEDWRQLRGTEPERLVALGGSERVLLYRLLLDRSLPDAVRAGLSGLFQRDYPKHASWISERADAHAQIPQDAEGIDWHKQLQPFLQELASTEPLPAPGGGDPRVRQELEELQQLYAELEAERTSLAADLEFAEDRAQRAHQRLREMESQTQQLRKQLRDLTEAAVRLRDERRTRIRCERKANEAQRELAHLRSEYVKLDRRLQQMAARLARAPGGESGSPLIVDAAALRQLSVEQVLGTGDRLEPDQIGSLRRRFASVFHPDRVKQLPSWAQQLCDDVLGAVNEACDRAESGKNA
jgi:hypothetical protein